MHNGNFSARWIRSADLRASAPFVEGLQSAGNTFRRALERLLHLPRRARTGRRLRALTSVRKTVFLCYGNICRSPFAAALFRRMLADEPTVSVMSAGFVGSGRPVPPAALEAARRRQIDLHTHRSTIVSHSLLTAADLIIVMSADQARALRDRFGTLRGPVVVLGDLDPQRIRGRTIVDPWGHDDATFEESYERITRCVRELVRLLSSASAEN